MKTTAGFRLAAWSADSVVYKCVGHNGYLA
jgi:hypothetical protein